MTLHLPRHPAIRVAGIPGRGRGLVAASRIGKGELIEAAPVIPLRRDELAPERAGLFSYPFDWPDPPYAEAIALGVISLVNHSENPNADFDPDLPTLSIRLFATRDIEAGEEVTIDYGIPLWFEMH